MSEQSAFRFRPFVSLLTAFSFLMIAVTGAVLYITPPGRVANWTDWRIWGLSKQQWGNLHICFSVLFILVSILHVWLNRKPLISYLVSKAAASKQLRLEWLVALAVCVIVFWGALKPFVPFSSLLDLNREIKFGWEKNEAKAPVPHAELLSIEALAKQAGVETETILKNLQSHQIEAAAGDIFGHVAEQHNLSPDTLYEMALPTPHVESGRGGNRHGGGNGGEGGGGFGRKTLQEACEELNLDVEQAIETLKTAGIEAAADQTIRQIADDNGVHPSEIRQQLQ